MVVNNSHGLILITESVSFSSPKSFVKFLKKISCFVIYYNRKCDSQAQTHNEMLSLVI